MRTYKLMVKRLLGKLGDILVCRNLFSMVDEADAYESLKEVAEKKIDDPAGCQVRLAQHLRLEKALDRSLQVAKNVLGNICGKGHMAVPIHLPEATREDGHRAMSMTSHGSATLGAVGKLVTSMTSHSSTALGETSQRASAMPTPRLEAAVEIDVDSEEEADVEEAKYVVADCKSRT